MSAVPNEGAQPCCDKPVSGESIPVLLLFGPTASGKTAILERLFRNPGGLAGVNAEIISADSMQVYRGMHIGVAKPSRELLAALPHHLIDIREIGEQFNAGEFVRLADEAALDIYARGALPVVSGGTGFYLRNFLLGLPESPPANMDVRIALREELTQKGVEPLREELAAGDPTSAQRIHPNDTYRLLRALEALRSAGRPLSGYRVPEFSGDGEVPGASLPGRPSYKFLLIGLQAPREELYRRINERCADMFHHGLVEEALRLRDAGYGLDDPGMRAIGYHEILSLPPEADPSDAEVLVAQNSRRYAKRQIAYFGGIPGVRWVSILANPAEEIRRELSLFLAGWRAEAGEAARL